MAHPYHSACTCRRVKYLDRPPAFAIWGDRSVREKCDTYNLDITSGLERSYTNLNFSLSQSLDNTNGSPLYKVIRIFKASIGSFGRDRSFSQRHVYQSSSSNTRSSNKRWKHLLWINCDN